MKSQSYSGIDLESYARILSFAARLSKLFSDSDIPLIDYRFVEKAFVAITHSRDLSRKDISYDAAMHDGAGVGVKTFGFSEKAGRKLEKVAEFTKDAKLGAFAGLPPETIASVVSDLRNARLQSDAAEVKIIPNKSFYHCLLRVDGGVIVHEEPMLPVDIDKIQPLSAQGKMLRRFSSTKTDHVRFTDGQKHYTFNRSKNTLSQKFRLDSGFSSEKLPLKILSNIWDLLMSGELDGTLRFTSDGPTPETVNDEWVVLPLYSTKSSIEKQVPQKSGINQWNAGGRQRSFGEAYIPIPRLVHHLRPGFFPPRDQKFELLLPSGEIVVAKVCQDGSKALMSDPNTLLCNWLFSTIDGSYSYAESRYSRRMPYTYDDLVRVGKDAVRIRKLVADGSRFELEFAPIGSFEEFIDEMESGTEEYSDRDE